MGKIALLYNTVKYLRYRQIVHQLLHRSRKIVRRALRLKNSFSHYRKGTQLRLSAYIPKYESCSGDCFTFLNLVGKFDGEWRHRDFGDLWSFNINYMEYLLQPSMAPECGKEWIMRFIAGQQQNAIGMSPYCISLRAVNWIKFVAKNRALFTAEELALVDTSLYSQYRILLGNMEYNLAGNHLLENFFSLLWGAFYFADEKMYKYCAERLVAELNEQTLADGANFEQSPMYHCIILDRILDCCNLLDNNERFATQGALRGVLRSVAVRMLAWLKAVSYSDGSYPLFNDSALGIAPVPAELYDYARRLGIEWGEGHSSHSGYRAVNTPRYELRMDVGGITASYIPGHSHADTFNFELRANGRPFIIDSGISTYQKCGRRAFERSTAAHNTVTVNDCDSSRVWSGFRCAQRARVTLLHEDARSIKASHDGYSEYGAVHTREFCWDESAVSVWDNLGADICGKAYLHFAPDVPVEISGDRVVTPLGTIIFENATSVQALDCEVSAEYNRLQPATAVCVSFKKELRTKILL